MPIQALRIEGRIPRAVDAARGSEPRRRAFQLWSLAAPRRWCRPRRSRHRAGLVRLRAMAASTRSTAIFMPSIRSGSCRCAISGLRNAKASLEVVMPRATSSSARTTGIRADSGESLRLPADEAQRESSAGAALREVWRCSELRPSRSPRLLVLFVVFVIVVVDDDVVKAFDIFKQRLETLVPLGGGLVQKNNRPGR